MPPELSAFAGMLGGILVGATYHAIATRGTNPHAHRLGRICWVRPHSGKRWREHVVVAVSWKGAICVRPTDRLDEDGYWIKKQNVDWRVRWVAPGGRNDG